MEAFCSFFWRGLWCWRETRFCVRGTRTQPLICVGCSVHYGVSRAINKGGFSRWHSSSSSTHICLALRRLLIRVSSAFIFQTFSEDCYSLFVNRLYFKSVLNLRKAYIFKSLLKVYYQSVFAEPFKTSMFQKFWRPLCHKVNLESCAARRRLCHKVNLPRCEARRRRFIMTYDIFATGQTNILGVGSMLFIRRKM